MPHYRTLLFVIAVRGTEQRTKLPPLIEAGDRQYLGHGKTTNRLKII